MGKKLCGRCCGKFQEYNWWELIDAALCCGSVGVYNMLQPEVAELGQQKVQNLLNTGATNCFPAILVVLCKLISIWDR